MTTATLIMNVALMVALSIVLAAVMVAVPNIDRLQAWRRRTAVRRARVATARREQRVRGALPTAS